MVRGLLIIIALLEFAGFGLILTEIRSDIQIIIAVALFGFALTHLALAAILSRIPLTRGTA